MERAALLDPEERDAHVKVMPMNIGILKSLVKKDGFLNIDILWSRFLVANFVAMSIFITKIPTVSIMTLKTSSCLRALSICL